MFTVPIFYGMLILKEGREAVKWDLQNCCPGRSRYFRPNVIACRCLQACFLKKFADYFSTKNSSFFKNIPSVKFIKTD